MSAETDKNHKLTDEIKSFQEFWPYYVREHLHPQSRQLHFVGTALTFFIFGWAVYSQNWWWLLAMPVIGYGFAWTGHLFFEKNKPATFKYPLMSLLADYYMFFKILCGSMGKELEKHAGKQQQKENR